MYKPLGLPKTDERCSDEMSLTKAAFYMAYASLNHFIERWQLIAAQPALDIDRLQVSNKFRDAYKWLSAHVSTKYV